MTDDLRDCQHQALDLISEWTADYADIAVTDTSALALTVQALRGQLLIHQRLDDAHFQFDQLPVYSQTPLTMLAAEIVVVCLLACAYHHPDVHLVARQQGPEEMVDRMLETVSTDLRLSEDPEPVARYLPEVARMLALAADITLRRGALDSDDGRQAFASVMYQAAVCATQVLAAVIGRENR